jgi:hypothetical protein
LTYKFYSEVVQDVSQKLFGDVKHRAEAKLAIEEYCRELKQHGQWSSWMDPFHQLSKAGIRLLLMRKQDVLHYLKKGYQRA